MFLWSGLWKNNACINGGRYTVEGWLGDEGWQRDLSTDDLGQFRPGDGPKVRSRSIPPSPQERETPMRDGVILGEAL